MEFEEVVKKRTATRKFSEKNIPQKTLERILKTASLAPTAKNLQPQKIYVLSSKRSLEKIDKISPCRYGAPTVLLVCSDKNIAWSDGEYSTYETDACIVATHIVLEATNLGVDNIWVRRFDIVGAKKEFSLPDNIEPICLIPMGYADKSYTGNPMHTVRKNLEETVIFENNQ